MNNKEAIEFLMKISFTQTIKQLVRDIQGDMTEEQRNEQLNQYKAVQMGIHALENDTTLQQVYEAIESARHFPDSFVLDRYDEGLYRGLSIAMQIVKEHMKGADNEL